jgi:hypothetical protein
MSFFRGKIPSSMTFFMVGTSNSNNGAGNNDAPTSAHTLYYLYYLFTKVQLNLGNSLDIGFYAIPMSLSEWRTLGGPGSTGVPQLIKAIATSIVPVSIQAIGSGQLYSLSYTAGNGSGNIGYTSSPSTLITTQSSQQFNIVNNEFNLDPQSLYAGVKYRLVVPGPTPKEIEIKYLRLLSNSSSNDGLATQNAGGKAFTSDCNGTGCNYALIDGAPNNTFTVNSNYVIPAVIPTSTFDWFLIPSTGVVYNNPTVDPITIPSNPAGSNTTTNMLDILEFWLGINDVAGTSLFFSKNCSYYNGSGITSGTSLFLNQNKNTDGTPIWSGCIFTNLADYPSSVSTESYWYPYCPSGSTSGTNTTCGSCFGMCPTNVGFCQRDYSIVSTITTGSKPLSCTPKQTVPSTGISSFVQKYKTVLIIAGIIAVVIFLLILIVFLFVLKHGKSKTQAYDGLKYTGVPLQSSQI